MDLQLLVGVNLELGDLLQALAEFERVLRPEALRVGLQLDQTLKLLAR